MLDRRMKTYGAALGSRALHRSRDLVVVANNAVSSDDDLALLLRKHRIAKLICSFPRSKTNTLFAELHRAGSASTLLRTTAHPFQCATAMPSRIDRDRISCWKDRPVSAWWLARWP
jgi:hypothetical protein